VLFKKKAKYVDFLNSSNFVFMAVAISGFYLFSGLSLLFYESVNLLFFTKCFKKVSANISVIMALIACFFISVFLCKGLLIALCAIAVFVCYLMFVITLKMILKDSMISLFVSTVLLLILSFLPQQILAEVFLVLFVGVLIFLGVKFKDVSNLLLKVCDRLSHLMFENVMAIFLCFHGLLGLGCKVDDGFIAYDAFHPIYEASIGHSYKKTLLKPVDLSYSGKKMAYHFLSTRLPVFLKNVLNINILDAIYFFTPFILFVIMSMALFFYFTKFLYFYIPFFILLFYPFWNFSGKYDCLYLRTVFSTPSFFLGFILFLFALYFFMLNKMKYFYAAMVLLLITKASFFITLCGGVGLFFLKLRKWRRLLFSSSILFLIFVLVVLLFLADAHAYNLWIVFPAFVYAAFFIKGSTWYWIIPTMVTFFVLAKCFFNSEKDSDNFLFLTSLGLSGMLLCIFCTEFAEANSWQFYVASFLPIVLVLWNRLQNNFKFKMIFWAYICFFTVVSAVDFFNRTYNVIFTQSSSDCILTDNLLNVYAWNNKNLSDDAIVMFGKHYESKIENWWPVTGFVRSAISDKQMYCENYIYKGVLMQDDYPLRVAFITHFYQKYVISSSKSKKLLKVFEQDDFGKQEGVPLNRETKLTRKFLFVLSGGKKWYVNNRSEQVNYEIKQFLNSKEFYQKNVLDIIRKEGITHVVLENGDQPTKELTLISREVYDDSSNKVLEFIL